MLNVSSGREHRPTPEKITDLAAEVVRGKIRLPKFQRDFVWSKGQVLDLMDSISRNYPIGSLLLWKSPADLVSDSDIAGLRIAPRETDGDTVYLLDGCQRMSVITGALYWESGDPNSYWNLVYDLDKQRFLHRADLDDPPPHQVPLNLISKTTDFFRRVCKLPEPLQERGMALFDRITSYEVAVVTLDVEEMPEIGRIFERINTRGTDLTRMQIVRAATWTSDFDLFDEIDQVRSALQAKHYGTIERDLLVRAVAAAAGLGFSKDDIVGLADIAHEDFRRAIKQTADASRRAVDFLWREIGTPTANALPYPNQLAVTIEIFRQLPKPDARQFGEIRRWFWRTALSGYYENWGSQRMLADLRAIRRFVGGTQTIEVDVPPLTTSLWTNVQYNRGSARTKAFALMLAAAGPRDLRSGQRIDAGRALTLANDMEFHHFFPKAWLVKGGIPSEKANVLANIVMLTSISNNEFKDRPPSAYLQDEIYDASEAEMKKRLETVLVASGAFQAAMLDDYESFIAARAEDLMAWAELLMSHEQVPREIGASGLTVVEQGELEEVKDNTDD